jgi:antiviral helicase SLH1
MPWLPLIALLIAFMQGGIDTNVGKVNVLLQSYIARVQADDFALVADMAYVAQNGARIARALLEMAMSRKWATVSAVLIGMCKAIEKQMWPYEQPMKQFTSLKQDVLYNLEQWADDLLPADLAAISPTELGKLIHMSERQGQALVNAAKQFPALAVAYTLRPIRFDILDLVIHATPSFEWNSRVHGGSEPFWLWAEESDGLHILQMSHLSLRPTTRSHRTVFRISMPDGVPSSAITVRYVSDSWIGAEGEIAVDLNSLIMPSRPSAHTQLLDLPLLPPDILHDTIMQTHLLRRLINFNAIQSQTLWSLLNTDANTLICAPPGSGKTTILSQATIWSVTLTLCIECITYST